MNKGIEILLERMKSNPEEFVGEGNSTKWAVMVREYEGALEPEDVKAFNDARKALLQEEFTQEVMKELLDPKEQGVLARLLHTKQQTATHLGGATPARTSGLTLQSDGNGGVVWANTAVNAQSYMDAIKYQTEQMQAHLDLHREVLRTAEKVEVKKEHKTLFGKLFNYL